MLIRPATAILAIGVLAILMPAAGAEPHAGAPEPPSSEALRERLTEREDERRPHRPLHVEVGHRPLTLEGEYELSVQRLELPSVAAEPSFARNVVEQELEGEAFYSFGRALSFFVQARIGWAEDLLAGTDTVSDQFIERGELWVHSGNLAGSDFSVELGRLNFEDDRRWWWDQTLDAIRLTYEDDPLEFEIALAEELGPTRSDQTTVRPEHNDIRRVIASVQWTWRENHSLQLFLLRHSDHSSSEHPGERVLVADKDESDARLTWIGGRLIGGVAVPTGILGYWFDGAGVWGSEHATEFDAADSAYVVAAARTQREIGGWGIDLGVNWLLSQRRDPRLYAGFAYGSGDQSPSSGRDHAFRQTTLQANEAGFGGMRRFAQYGEQLDPELSNLMVWTLGFGWRVLASSSIDCTYHHYRLVEPATSLRDADIDAHLDGLHRGLGDGLDFVVAIEEWERLELEFTASTFHGGPAFGHDGRWSHGALFALRVAF